MNEKELGRALLAGEGTRDIDVTELTRRVLRRDRRRVWVLGTLCVVAWMLVVMLPWSTVLPMLAKVVEHFAQTDGAATTTAPATADHERMIELMRIVKTGTIATFAGSIAAMFMAAVCTVALVVTSRRATLRQVNARLAEISEQLKLLARRPG